MSGDEKIQIVAFSTNDNNQSPNDIINIFLEYNNHLILKKSRHAIAFSTNLANSSKTTKIMVCSVLNLQKEYTGITDVNCYILFIDLENADSKEKLDTILNYAKDYCELTKKIFVLGMVGVNEDGEKHIAKEDITKTFDEAQLNYEYKEIDLAKKKEVSDAMMGIFIYSSKHSISGEVYKDKDEGKNGSCEIY